MNGQSLRRFYGGLLRASGGWLTLLAIAPLVSEVGANPVPWSELPTQQPSPARAFSIAPHNPLGMDGTALSQPNAIATIYFDHQSPLPLGPSPKREGMVQEQLASDLEARDPLGDSPESPRFAPPLNVAPLNNAPSSPHLSNDDSQSDTPAHLLSEPSNSESLETPSPASSEADSAESSSAPQYSLTPLQLSPTQLINLETANVLPAGSLLITSGAHIFPRDQTGAGTGLQTYSASIEGGVTDRFQLGLAWVFFDDPLGQSFQEGVPNLGLMVFAPKFKYQFLKEDNFSLAVAGSLEIGKFTGSYGLYTPNNLQQTTTTVGGTVQVAFTYTISDTLQWHLVPGAVFWPTTINNGGAFYGTFLNLGTGLNFTPIERLTLFADVNVPLSNGNAVNNQGQIVQKPVWSAGLTYLQSPTVGVDLYATNALGATPATRTLAFIPNGNQVAAGINLRYTPDLGQKYPTSFRKTTSPLSIRDTQLLLNGITVTSAETLVTGMLSLQGGTGPGINFQLSYGLSDDAQIELVGQQLANNAASLDNNFKLGAYAKLRFLSQTNGDPFSFSIAGGIEQGTVEPSTGLVTTELAFLYQVTPQFTVMFNPKASFFGGNSIVGAGLGLNYELFKGIQVIGEVTPILSGEVQNTVWAGGLRYLNPNWNVGVDIYGTNGAGTYGIGGLIGQPNNQVSVGFNLLWLLGAKPNPVVKVPSSTPIPGQ
jgi:hypothetical protein